MALEIVKVQNDKKPEGEYILLKATEKLNLGGYALVDKTFANDVLSNEFRHVYFFPKTPVEKGEYIALFTKKGSYSKGKLTSGEPCHFFYWNADSCVWNDAGGDTVTLFKYSKADSKVVGKVS